MYYTNNIFVHFCLRYSSSRLITTFLTCKIQLHEQLLRLLNSQISDIIDAW